MMSDENAMFPSVSLLVLPYKDAIKLQKKLYLFMIENGTRLDDSTANE